MRPLTADSSIEEIAAAISGALASAGITAVLSGGAAVQIYSKGLYVSRDLDFISMSSLRDIEPAVRGLGFERQSSRHFVHPTLPYTLEFPPWPLAIGAEIVREWGSVGVGPTAIAILTPTQCVMDRLAAFYFWRDRQGLDQAVAVASAHPVDLEQIRQWSEREGRSDAHREFERALARGSERPRG